MTQNTPGLTITQDGIEQFEATAVQFFDEVLDLDFGACLVTDEADLSDFSFNGQPAGTLDIEAMSQRELLQAWDRWVLARVKAVYGIELSTTQINLVSLFRQIEEATRPVTLH